MNDGINVTAERHAAFHAFWYQLVLAAHIRLEVTVLGVGALLACEPAALHRTHGAHAAVALVLLALNDDDIARGLGSAREHRAQHDRIRAGGQRLGNITGVLHTAIRDDRHARRTSCGGGFHNGGNLRRAHARHDAGSTDRAGADTDLDGIRAGLNHVARSSTGG